MLALRPEGFMTMGHIISTFLSSAWKHESSLLRQDDPTESEFIKIRLI